MVRVRLHDDLTGRIELREAPRPGASILEHKAIVPFGFEHVGIDHAPDV
jgi:hypothetical protein